eukprot:jgi/Mesen1/9298/ME000060S08734
MSPLHLVHGGWIRVRALHRYDSCATFSKLLGLNKAGASVSNQALAPRTDLPEHHRSPPLHPSPDGYSSLLHRLVGCQRQRTFDWCQCRNFGSKVVISAGLLQDVDSSRAARLNFESSCSHYIGLSSFKPVEDGDLKKVEACLKGPTLERYPDRHGRENVRLFLALGMDPVQVAKVLNTRPSLCNFDARKRLPPKWKLFQQYGLSIENFLKAGYRSPQMLTVSDEHIFQVCQFLKVTLKVENVGKIIGNFPSILNLTIPNLQAKKVYLEGEGLEDVGSAVVKFPNLLRLSTNVLPAKIKSLRGLLGVENLGAAIAKSPRILGAKSQSLQETFEYLVQRFGKETAMEMILKQPSVLAQSWTGVKKKLDFIEQEMECNVIDVVVNPNMLAMSLEGTIMPRYYALKEIGDHRRYSLSTILSISRAHFLALTGITYKSVSQVAPNSGAM